MPRHTVVLAAEDDAFVNDMVASGRYQDAGEALRDAVGRLRRSVEENDAKRAVLRGLLDEAIGEVERGEGLHLTRNELQAHLDRLVTGDTGGR